MNDKEQFENLSECHMYLAIQRKKDGAACKRVHRQIIYDEERDLDILLAKISDTPGVWRIYHTVNKRDMKKALKNFKHILIDTDKTSVESMWRKELLQPENRAERKFMIDLDDKSLLVSVRRWLTTQNISFTERVSPNGFHIITPPFNRKLFAEDFPGVDVLIDGYYYYHKEIVGCLKEN